MVAQIILQAGGKDFAPDNFDWINTRPNSVYNNIVDEIINGSRTGWLYGELEKFNYQNGTITNCPTSS